LPLLRPAGLARQVALADQLLEESLVRAAVCEIAATADAQRLVNRAFELAVALLDITVLVGDPEVIGGRHQLVVRHQ
jgi:hypothetical protein